MSDQIVQSVNGTNVSSGHRYLRQRTSCDAAGETHNQTASKNKSNVYADCTNGKGNIPGGCHSFGEGTSKKLPRWKKSHLIAEHSHLQGASLDSSSHIVPYRFYLEETKLGKGKVAISRLVSRSNVVSKQVPNSKTRVFEQEQKSDNSMDGGCYKANNTLENQKCLGIEMFPGQCITEAETRRSCNDCDSLLKLQNCVHEVQTKRICTTMDDSEGPGRGCPRFSQTTQSLLITEKNDVNLLKEDDMFTSTRVISTSSDLHQVSLFLGQGKPKIESQLLSSSVDLDVKEKVKPSKVSIKNEFSAETDAMEMESYREKKLHSGSCSTGSTKVHPSCLLFRIKISEVLDKKSNLSSWLGLASSVKVESQQSNFELPDMNFPALPENTDPISSKRTQSLEMETLLGQDEHLNGDPGMRWVKRLKLNTSNSSAQYTKISENQSHENVTKPFSTIPESISDHDKESNPSDNLIEDPSKNANGLLLSHAWVQRWLSNGSRVAQTKSETPVSCEPQGSRFALEREMCPSIAAMALMGKALSCFQPCDFQKKGSLTVWNTNAI